MAVVAVVPNTENPQIPPPIARPLNLDPLIPVFRRILRDVDFARSLKTTVDVLDSSPFVNVSLVSLKSAPYVFFGDERIVKEFDNGVSCRLRYLESAVTSLAAVVYNFVFGAIFSVLSLVTLGQVKLIVDQMRKHWIHSALAVASLGISCAGTVSPNLGIKANLAGGFAVGVALLQWMQGDVITKICTAYQRRNREIQQAVSEACLASGINFDREFRTLFNHLDANLNDRVQTFSEFIGVVHNAVPHFPRIVPIVTPSVIIDNLQQLASEWRGGSSSGNREPESGTSAVASIPHFPRIVPIVTPSVIIDNLQQLASEWRGGSSSGNREPESGTSAVASI